MPTDLDFELVLKQDLANVVSKSASGAPLTARERKMIEDEKRKQLTSISKPTDQVAEERVLLKTGYFYEYKYYATTYGAGLRTVKRWVERGRENDDPCPLDDAGEMRGWWTRNQKNKCPDKLLAAAVAAVRKKANTANSEGSTSTKNLSKIGEDSTVKIGEEQSSAGWRFSKSGEGDVGLEASLLRLRNMEYQAHHQAEEALKAGDEAKATMALNMWNKLLTQVRQVEKEARADAEARGVLVPRPYIEKKIGELHIPIQASFRNMYRDMCEVMSIAIDSNSEKKWNDLCDKNFNQLQEEIFLK